MASPLDPFSAVARKTSVSYTTAYLIVALLAAAVAFAGLGVCVTGWSRLFLVALAGCLALATLTGSIVAAVKRPDMFKSEGHLEFVKLLEWVADPKVDENAIRGAERMLPRLPGRVSPKSIDHEDEDRS